MATFAAAELAWRRLRAAFPLALALVLMPDHLHLITALEDPDGVRRRLGAVLSGLARSASGFKGAPVWAPVPSPEPVLNRKHLRRLVRYVALNPCRDELTRDPLRWLWSTHRDVMGAVVDPWVTAPRLAAALGVSPSGFEAAHHAYVSADPTTNVAGTPLPRPARPSESPLLLLDQVRAAAAVALRAAPAAIARRTVARRLFVHLATAQGWRDARLIGAQCGLDARAVGRLPPPPAAALTPALLCLGDERLRHPAGVPSAPKWPPSASSRRDGRPWADELADARQFA